MQLSNLNKLNMNRRNFMAGSASTAALLATGCSELLSTPAIPAALEARIFKAASAASVVALGNGLYPGTAPLDWLNLRKAMTANAISWKVMGRDRLLADKLAPLTPDMISGVGSPNVDKAGILAKMRTYQPAFTEANVETVVAGFDKFRPMLPQMLSVLRNPEQGMSMVLRAFAFQANLVANSLATGQPNGQVRVRSVATTKAVGYDGEDYNGDDYADTYGGGNYDDIMEELNNLNLEGGGGDPYEGTPIPLYPEVPVTGTGDGIPFDMSLVPTGSVMLPSGAIIMPDGSYWPAGIFPDNLPPGPWPYNCTTDSFAWGFVLGGAFVLTVLTGGTPWPALDGLALLSGPVWKGIADWTNFATGIQGMAHFIFCPL